MCTDRLLVCTWQGYRCSAAPTSFDHYPGATFCSNMVSTQQRNSLKTHGAILQIEKKQNQNLWVLLCVQCAFVSCTPFLNISLEDENYTCTYGFLRWLILYKSPEQEVNLKWFLTVSDNSFYFHTSDALLVTLNESKKANVFKKWATVILFTDSGKNCRKETEER